MLQLKNISKVYKTGDLVQTALDGVSINLRDNEFVAILGPSGSGKTTLLNIIGGLDRYDSGDLIINNISTQKYSSRDWDSYRNHTIGFVFQSYNLIPHQTVLSNVELALTISGVSRSERRRRAKEALEKVGLGRQLHKKPNQMSGGQMQRVAIARALINDPDILLADEPTGALDTETSLQVMELLKEVAKDRLVVMVTHNPELAEEYATRIVNLKDGRVTGDSMPYEIDENGEEAPKHENMGKSSMSFLTALSLSFSNLRTKIGRTLLTAFAGSIGIIGIALILSLSNGVNNFIIDIQKSTMTSYPITIDETTIDLSSFLTGGQNNHVAEKAEHELDGVYSNVIGFELASAMTTSITENNLTEFKNYLDDEDSAINEFIGENGVVYTYSTDFDVFTHDPEGTLINTDGSTLTGGYGAGGMGSSSMMSMSAMSAAMSNFREFIPDREGKGISAAVTNNYEVVWGRWCDRYDEVVLIVDRNNEISASRLYQLGLLNTSEYREIMKQLMSGEEIELEPQKWSYDDIAGKEFVLIPECDRFIENDNGTFDYVAGEAGIESLMEDALRLKVVGIITASDDDSMSAMVSPVGYTRALTDWIVEHTENSAVVKAQKADKETNVLNGLKFTPADDEAKKEDAKTYIASLGISDKANLAKALFGQTMGAEIAAADEATLAGMLDNYMLNPADEMLLGVYDNFISAGTFEENMDRFGVVGYDAPSSISIYTDTFENKDKISDCIDEYNKTADEENKITYTDYVGVLMSSVTTVIDVISYVLIAFVAVSLVVSSIMIGIITYISVLERTKEIGILRALGASKRNISQVFNAETFIVGLVAGLLGIGITLLLIIPGNMLIHSLTDEVNVSAALPPLGAVILVVLSMVLTMIGGLIPSAKAATMDPVAALRSE